MYVLLINILCFITLLLFQVFDTLFEKMEYQEAFTLLAILLHPYSKGNITLRSTNPLDPPVIHANYFRDPRDADVFMDGTSKVTILSQKVE